MAIGDLPHVADDATGESAATKGGVLCPRCGSDRIRRIERKGFLQRKVYPIFGYFPWRCSQCRAHVLMMRRRLRKGSKKKVYTE